MISFNGFSKYDMTTVNYLRELHKKCWNNRALLSEAKNCGCFYCRKTFASDQIVDWTDEGQTALCPLCGIDAVLGVDTEVVDQMILQQMHEYWFKRTIQVSSDEWQEALQSNAWPSEVSERKQ